MILVQIKRSFIVTVTQLFHYFLCPTLFCFWFAFPYTKMRARRGIYAGKSTHFPRRCRSSGIWNFRTKVVSGPIGPSDSLVQPINCSTNLQHLTSFGSLPNRWQCANQSLCVGIRAPKKQRGHSRSVQIASFTSPRMSCVIAALKIGEPRGWSGSCRFVD